MTYLIENANRVIPLLFALVGLVLLVVVVVANLAGFVLTGEVFELVKLVIVSSFSSAGATVMTSAAVAKQQEIQAQRQNAPWAFTAWAKPFTDREKKEIEFARLYADHFNHGTDGHNAKQIIAKLSRLLDERSAEGGGEHGALG